MQPKGWNQKIKINRGCGRDHQSQHCKAEKKFDTFVLGGTMNSCKDGECPVKTGTGFQTPLKDSAGDRPSITATSVPDAVCRVSCARSASASRDAHTHVPYCDTCLHLPRAQKSLHMDSGRHSCMPMHRLWPSAGCGPMRGLVCAVSARRCECQRQLQRALPVVHTCDSDYSHYTGEHVLVRDGTRQK